VPATRLFSVPFEANLDDGDLDKLSEELGVTIGRVDDDWDKRVGWKLLAGKWDESPTYLRLYRDDTSHWEFLATTVADDISDQDVRSWHEKVEAAVEAVGGVRRVREPVFARVRGSTSKQAFVAMVASKTQLSKSDAAKAVDAFLETVTESLKRGEDVSFTGFGKFSTQRRAARQGVNPRNPSEKVQIPAATVPKFSAGSQLKQAVRGGGGRR
jgi:DNA-binding protein HU-beta